MLVINKNLNRIFNKKIIKIIKYFNIFFYNLFIWVYIIILVYILINKKYFKVIYNVYKYLINFLFIILLLNKCQKSDLN
ncbi:probable protein, unknown function (apicoplast) [Plasmodium vinckei lentum]|uniref:Uncharacterized protein n=1 Tax=Plasmodium vinckei lentum TaxID=138297 RepID=A0A6V7T4J8_PLAVN|nr:probable protein, unknown function [Plasmodium vinckei lentum]